MTTDSLSRSRDSKALTHLQRQHAPSGQASARSDWRSRSATSQTEMNESLARLGLPEPPARISVTSRWRAQLTGAVQAAARWVAVSAGVAIVHFAAWRLLFFP